MNVPELAPQDNWHRVEDPKKRKQIQDRLAQRARRKRLAKAKVAAETRTAEHANSVNLTRHEHTQTVIDNRSVTESYHLSDKSNVLHSNAFSGQSFLSALFETGKILGIRCGENFPSKSKPAPPGTPLSLQPTLLQLSTVHWQWIDRWPFSDFRDEIIINSGNIDEEEFLEDLFNMESFSLAPGRSPWDPSAYTIHPQFQAKWGFLFSSFS